MTNNETSKEKETAGAQGLYLVLISVHGLLRGHDLVGVGEGQENRLAHHGWGWWRGWWRIFLAPAHTDDEDDDRAQASCKECCLHGVYCPQTSHSIMFMFN